MKKINPARVFTIPPEIVAILMVFLVLLLLLGYATYKKLEF